MTIRIDSDRKKILTIKSYTKEYKIKYELKHIKLLRIIKIFIKILSGFNMFPEVWIFRSDPGLNPNYQK
jgi:hypothetical protein